MKKVINILLAVTAFLTSSYAQAREVPIGYLPQGVTAIQPYSFIDTGNGPNERSWERRALKTSPATAAGVRPSIDYRDGSAAMDYAVVMNGKTLYTPAFTDEAKVRDFFARTNWQDLLQPGLADPSTLSAKKPASH